MNLKLTVFLLCIGLIASAQVFNRSLLVTGNQYDPVVMRNGGATYVSFLSGEDPGYHVSTIYKVNELGETVAMDSLDSKSAAGWSYPLGVMRPMGFYKMPDSSFFLYGRYVDDCHGFNEMGIFIIHYDKDLKRVKERSYVDSMGTDNIDLFALNMGGYGLVRDKLILQLANNLHEVNRWTDMPGARNGSIYLGGDSILRQRWPYSGVGTPTAGLSAIFDFNTGVMRVITDSIIGPAFDLNDSSFVVEAPNMDWFVYDKRTLGKIDSVDVSSLTGFLPYYSDFSSDAIVLCDTQNYVVVSKDDFSIRASGSLAGRFKTNWPGVKSTFYFEEPYLAAAKLIESGQIHLESFNVDLPRAPLFDNLELKVSHINSFVTNRDTTIGSGRTLLETNSTWKVTVRNASPDTLYNAKFTYNNDFDVYCGGPNVLIISSRIQIAPQDSFSFILSGLNYSNVTDTTDFKVFVNVAAVEANGKILGKTGWIGGNYTIKNISVSELDLLETEVSVYPNPTWGILNVNLPEQFVGEIYLVDVSGKTVMKKEVLSGQNGLGIDVAHLLRGVYVLTISNQTSIKRCKVLVR